jgi:putative glutamine amidotransferase
MRTRPVIGVTLDAEEPGGYSKLPWYALRKNYFSAIAAAGGLPVALPHDAALAEAYLDEIDGLVITGGAFDVDPSLYGGGDTHPTVTLKAGRTDFELAVTRGALARDMPVLGICGGQQLLNVVLGGTLHQDLGEDGVDDARGHLERHDVIAREDSIVRRVTGRRSAVASEHHQGIRRLGRGLRVTAESLSGLPEAVEVPGRRFAVGVQWHAEREPSGAAGARVAEAFVEALAA